MLQFLKRLKGSPDTKPGDFLRTVILEFILIFMAVYCGYLAEDYRKEKEDREKERIYINELLADLNLDSDRTDKVLKDTMRRYGVDTLLSLMARSSVAEIDTRKLYRLNERFVGGYRRMVFNRGTFDQLVSTGDLGLIQNRIVSKDLNNLINQQNQIEDEYHNFRLLLIELVSVQRRVIDFSYRENEFHRRAAIDDIVRMQKPALLTDEISIIKEYAGHLSVTQLVLDSYYWRVSNYRESNLALQTLIRKEYGI